MFKLDFWSCRMIGKTKAMSSHKSRASYFFLIYGIGVAFCFLFLVSSPAKAQSNRTGAAVEPFCRFGVNAKHDGSTTIADFDLGSLRTGWYIDYRANPTAPRPNGMQYAPMIRLKQTGPNTYTYSPNGSTLKNAITKNPGADWLIGNEPDRRIFQDDMEPVVYAAAYHELYNLIKQQDGNAKIFPGSIVQPTLVRLQYLDLVLKSYQAQFGNWMPVDGWSIHNFILNEASCDHYEGDTQICWGADIPPGISVTDGLRITVGDNDRFDLFVEQIVRFRQWMSKRGYRNTPLYLTEYGVLMPAGYGFPESRVNSFMNKTFDYLLNTTDPTLGYPADNDRLVQRFSWYSTNDNVSFNGYLFEKPSEQSAYQLSLMGQNYALYTQNITNSIDIYPVNVALTPPAPLVASAPVTFTITAAIANSGHQLTPISVTVRFYDGDPASTGNQIGSDQVVQLSGCGSIVNAQVLWENIPSGNYAVYVVIDPSNQIAEPGLGEQNNTRQQTVYFATQTLYLPLISRTIDLQ